MKWRWLLALAIFGALLASGQENFTGTVKRLESNIPVRAARIRFEPGARTKWHVHERGQVLLCEEGLARTQVQGHPLQVLHPGETAYVPGGVPHWHGASPDQATVLFSVDVSNGQTKWLGEVTDAEYRGGRKP